MSTSTASASPVPRRRADRVGFGILLALIVVLAFTIQDATSKILVQTYSPFQTTMVRYWGFAVFSLIVAARQAPLREALRSRYPLLQIVRGVLLVLDIWFFATGLQTVPLAEMQAIVLVYPLMVTLAAVPFLGEKVGPFRLVAVAVGFAGALLVIRPGAMPFGWGAFYSLVSAACYAVYIVVTRRISAHDGTAVSMVYVALVGLVMTTAVGLPSWQPIEPGAIGYFLVVVATTCIGHGLMMKALSLAPASVLQPFNYLVLPAAVVLGVVIFNHWVDPLSLVGAALVVGAGLVVMAREQWLQRQSGVDATTLPGKE